MNGDRIVVRPRAGNLDHHLWNNNDTFWCHYTVHLRDFTKERWRVLLGTDDIHDARRHRDSLLGLLSALDGAHTSQVLPC